MSHHLRPHPPSWTHPTTDSHPGSVALTFTTTTTPTPPAPGLQAATKNSTDAWQEDLEGLFRHAKDRFPDVVWELVGDEEDPGLGVEEVWGHKAIVYARAPPSFQNRYFSFRPNGAASPLPYSSSPSYPAESALSLSLGHGHGLGLEASVASFASGQQPPRTPSPFRPSSPSTTAAHAGTGPSASTTLLRLTTSINPALFSNELEYLYTGKGFGEAFEFLFDSSESRDHHHHHHQITNGPGGRRGANNNDNDDEDDPEAQRIDKLRKDLVFMWRSRLYSDVRIALTGNFGGNHESTTAIFSSHRFILVSRSSYFSDALSSWPSSLPTPASSPPSEPPTLTLPSPPFTPASLHFTLGFLYTGTLIFSHRSYDLSTAFAILKAALYLSIPTLHVEIQARIVQEMMHGLFHAFISFSEYESLTGGRWGTGGCRCRQCARRAPRILEFALEEDVKNPLLERGARRALVGLFGEGWCTPEFASLPLKIRESLLKGLAKRTTPLNVFPLLFAAEHALAKIGSVIEPWGDVVRDMLGAARKVMDELLARESEACFGVGVGGGGGGGVDGEGKEKDVGMGMGREEWMEVMESDGVRFEDGERVEWVMAAVLRGVKEPNAPSLYQTLVSSILLLPHPHNPSTTLLAATSHVRVQVEQARLDLLKWIAARWLVVREKKGFDELEGWALKEISDHIEVPIDDLLSPPAYTSSSSHSKGHGPSPKRHPTHNHLLAHNHLRPLSNHPHTSKVDADSDVASSMRVSVLSRSLPMRQGGSGSGSGASFVSASSTAASREQQQLRRDREDGQSLRSGVGTARSSASMLSYVSRDRESVSTVSTARHALGPGSTHTNADANVNAGTIGNTTGNTTGTNDDKDKEMSPAKRLASDVRAGRAHAHEATNMKDRPDSKLEPSSASMLGNSYAYGRSLSPTRQPSIVEPPLEEEEEGLEGREEEREEEEGDGDGDGDEQEQEQEYEEDRNESETGSVYHTPPLRQKTLITRASLASVSSRSSTRPGTGATPSLRSLNSNPSAQSKSRLTSKSPTPTTPTRKSTLSTLSSVSSASARTSQYSNAVSATASPSPSARPSSRGSTRSRLTSTSTLSKVGVGVKASPGSTSRPGSRVSTRSISGGNANRPTSTATESTNTSGGTYRTANTSTGTGTGLSTPVGRSRRTSAASTATANSTLSVRTAAAAAGGRRSASGSPVNERTRKISGASVSSVASTAGSVRSTTKGRTTPGPPKRAPPVPATSPAVVKSKSLNAPIISGQTPRSPAGMQTSFSSGSVKSVVEGLNLKDKKPVVVVGTLGRKPAPASASEKAKEKEKVSEKVSEKVLEKKSAESVKKPVQVEGTGTKKPAESESESKPAPAPPSPTSSIPPQLPSKDNNNVKELEKEKENVGPPPPPAPLPTAAAAAAPALSGVESSSSSEAREDPLVNTASQITIRPKTKTHTRSEVLSGASGSSGSSGGGGSNANEHKKTSSSASTSSVATLKRERRGSADTLRTVKSSALSASSENSAKESKILPPPPTQQPLQKSLPQQSSSHPPPPVSHSPLQSKPSLTNQQLGSIDGLIASDVPTGSTLEIGIPCIISSKRKRFKAYARYIGEVAGETGSWVGVEVPMPMSDSWADDRPADDRQWNDGSWGGIRYFEIGGGGVGSEVDYGYGDDRASRRRRIDGGSVGGAVWVRDSLKGGLKREREREGDQLSISEERMKRMRSVSPAVSDMSGTESRGLFVRPQQVLYVVDAVGADL